MSIRVRYFASLKESVGRSDDELHSADSLSVKSAWDRLNPNIPLSDSVLAAVNMEYVSFDTLLSDGDELAFFPPVTGG